MPSQSDYANIALALSTLAKAPVAAYPESGPFLLAEQAQDIARAKLAEEARRKAQKRAKKKAKRATIGRAVGTVAGTVLGGPIGASLGGELGSVVAGGSFDPGNLSAQKSLTIDDLGAALGTVQSTPRRRRRNKNSLNDSFDAGFGEVGF